MDVRGEPGVASESGGDGGAARARHTHTERDSATTEGWILGCTGSSREAVRGAARTRTRRSSTPPSKSTSPPSPCSRCSSTVGFHLQTCPRSFKPYFHVQSILSRPTFVSSSLFTLPGVSRHLKEPLSFLVACFGAQPSFPSRLGGIRVFGVISIRSI